ncbi:uncharacterized protein M437DRAFT_35864 [Aureobasidium melanogenum CBS 110374]|uniref:DUF676 domain-containing protein n=1 Tax=Aureobasidium melanogenum (strain CBS 110374) TaxID=1043003 RepID=A0A074WZQ2_AURM1|nr:uncharacterized protein M437DRAFT_35864 [Aureobasidium melanogenum CBS 110374]KEQ67906.1 hypothetical protein M437DRAFT_35864 [Aureobasidium melanogenum CBS 110374]
MPTKSLLLVFIHGFKGGDHTFDGFPDHFRTLVQNALPKINVLSIVYPKFETQGDLNECVAKFHGWLLNKCIDLEVANGTPSPTIDPSVRVVLVGHSMGGIVAAETLLSIARDPPVPSIPSQDTDPAKAPEFLFPYIQAVLAFDTPYLGIHPGVVAHGAEEHYNTASAALNAYNQASQFFGLGKSSTPAPPTKVPAGALPPPEAGGWGKWGKYAMFAGGAAALAAAGGAAWQNRESISKGWAWAGGHLEFVGCLARGADLTKRVESVAALSSSHKIGFADFYTCLDTNKQGKTYYSEQLLGEERTFCVVPKEAKEQRGTWVKCINEKASNEIAAHVAMFTPKDNPDYYAMADRAKVVLVKAVDMEWYESSSATPEATPEPEKQSQSGAESAQA